MPGHTEQARISGEDRSSSATLNLEFSERTASGTVTINGNTVTLEDPIVKVRGEKIFVFDEDIKILLKKVGDNRWFVISVYDTGDGKVRHRYILEEAMEEPRKITGQRNLHEENDRKEEKEPVPDHMQILLEQEQKQLERAEMIHQQKLDRINAQERERADRNEILDKFRESQKQTGPGLNEEPEEESETKTGQKTEQKAKLTSDTEISAFVSVPRQVMWKDELRFTILVTDDSAHRYDPTYKTNIGNRLDDAIVTGKILNPNGRTLEKFNGTTQEGEFLGTWIVPENSITRGEYTILANAEKSFKDGDADAKARGTFFVFPITSDGSGAEEHVIEIVENIEFDDEAQTTEGN